ncbi:alpha-hydroxy-acid oxidizing protein [Xanthobacter dioxanivorans]|uniref:Alpha-hydroxy-acid oxidizing protein n=1 Tax=Xanthobacter dioxanivorans TaxID=2528964 RepID=A0A974SLA1_9HYPH|nr:alpha-hydroxy acid oxidase [Xanthobacter dioxanivorans]QRG09084.1 alpha-hydroxy-acid oxidizing protein [Xanthobacter dioxanivorans]
MDTSADIFTNDEIVTRARARLAPAVWDYLTGGAESERALCGNRLALDSLAFLPRVLRDVAERSTATSLFGRSMALPAFLAPIGSLSLFDKEGALASAAAARAAGVPCFISIMSQPALEEVARAEPDAVLILQIYVRGDRDWLRQVVGRAEAAGCAAICLTVDSAVYGRRERDLRNRFSSAAAVDRVNFDDRKSVQITTEQAALSWDDVAFLRSLTRLPLILKGILHPEDARLAAEHGADAVYLSNHGGRQLDHCVPALDQIEAARAAIGADKPVLVDGGFLRGTDIAKALALGATAAGLGKLQGLALAAGGRAGVETMLSLLKAELSNALALLGCRTVAQLDAALLRRTQPGLSSSVLSTFIGQRQPQT